MVDVARVGVSHVVGVLVTGILVIVAVPIGMRIPLSVVPWRKAESLPLLFDSRARHVRSDLLEVEKILVVLQNTLGVQRDGGATFGIEPLQKTLGI